MVRLNVEVLVLETRSVICEGKNPNEKKVQESLRHVSPEARMKPLTRALLKMIRAQNDLPGG